MAHNAGNLVDRPKAVAMELRQYLVGYSIQVWFALVGQLLAAARIVKL